MGPKGLKFITAFRFPSLRDADPRKLQSIPVQSPLTLTHTKKKKKNLPPPVLQEVNPDSVYQALRTSIGLQNQLMLSYYR